MTNPARLSGPCYLESFIVTPNARPSIGTGFAKTHANPNPPAGGTATPLNRWAVSFKFQASNLTENFFELLSL
jgi:hypothetical protein